MKEQRIKLVSLSKSYIDLISDNEILYTSDISKRANLLLVKLSFRENKYSFAIPWRSNVSNFKKFDNYIFKLPITSKTRDNHVACLDFRKMCPITKKSMFMLENYHLNSFSNDVVTVRYIKDNYPEIIRQSQGYLHRYEKGLIRSDIIGCVDLDNAINKLKDSGY